MPPMQQEQAEQDDLGNAFTFDHSESDVSSFSIAENDDYSTLENTPEEPSPFGAYAEDPATDGNPFGQDDSPFGSVDDSLSASDNTAFDTEETNAFTASFEDDPVFGGNAAIVNEDNNAESFSFSADMDAFSADPDTAHEDSFAQFATADSMDEQDSSFADVVEGGWNDDSGSFDDWGEEHQYDENETAEDSGEEEKSGSIVKTIISSVLLLLVTVGVVGAGAYFGGFIDDRMIREVTQEKPKPKPQPKWVVQKEVVIPAQGWADIGPLPKGYYVTLVPDGLIDLNKEGRLQDIKQAEEGTISQGQWLGDAMPEVLRARSLTGQPVKVTIHVYEKFAGQGIPTGF
jgi:hypothetical protein